MTADVTLAVLGAGDRSCGARLRVMVPSMGRGLSWSRSVAARDTLSRVRVLPVSKTSPFFSSKARETSGEGDASFEAGIQPLLPTYGLTLHRALTKIVQNQRLKCPSEQDLTTEVPQRMATVALCKNLRATTPRHRRGQ